MPNKILRIIYASHETVHHIQSQEFARGGSERIRWIYEGAAEALTYRMLETKKIISLEKLKTYYLASLCGISTIPKLNELRDAESWYRALGKYGDQVTYKVAELALYELMKSKGDSSPFMYFRTLNLNNEDLAFHDVFGMLLRSYEEKFDDLIRQEIAQFCR